MKPAPEDAGGSTPNPKPEGHAEESGRDASGSKQETKPFTGGYYWLPRPTPGGITWSVVTCRDLGCGRDAGHDADLWPRLMAPLAEAWGKDALVLKKKLALYYTALPRGRVTRPEKTFLVLHGKDSPTAGWEEMVIAGFRLSGRQVKFIFDAHETQLPGHPEKFSSIFGPVH